MNIYVHCGHSKTGSSAIQSFFSKNIGLLENYGLKYPKDKSVKLAKKGGVTSGNMRAFERYLDNPSLFEVDEDLVFSSESIFNWLADPSSRLYNHPFKDRLVVIIYTRDVFDHLLSSWGQNIKRGGGVFSLEEYAELKYNLPFRLSKSLRVLEGEGVEFVLKNYSYNREGVVESFLKLLCPERWGDILKDAEYVFEKVNRSLNFHEIELQRLFNFHYGRKSSQFISDPLVEKLPSVSLGSPKISQQAVDIVIEKFSSDFEIINNHLPDSEGVDFRPPQDLLRLGDADNDFEEKFKFSYEQLNILAQSISNRIMNLERGKDV
ncbi:MAG: hypothetical protein ACQEXI_17445 [Pseudomonadota bacterium]